MDIKNTLTAFGSILNSNNNITEIAYFNNIRKELLLELKKATSDIKIAVTWFTDNKLFDELCKLLEKGVNIELIIADHEINNRVNGLNFQKFIDLGGKLYYYNIFPMNHKYCIIDNDVLFNGSYNWTYYSEYQSIDNIIKYKGRQKLIKSFSTNFNKLKKSLEPTKVAVEKSVLNIDANNLFSMKNYLAMDLLYQGKEVESLVPIESAMELLPDDSLLQKTYEKFIDKGITKKTATDLGISAVMDGDSGRFSILIPSGVSIPYSNHDTYYTSHDNQKQILISTHKGKDDYVKNNITLGEFSMDVNPKKAGDVSVNIQFDIDELGNLNVTCKNNDDGKMVKVPYYSKDLIM